jgi:hypothetical protein
MSDDDDYFGPPAGKMGVGDWHVAMRDGRHLHVSGVLEFTARGSALVWSDLDTPRLVLGVARGRWGSIVAEDGECEE